MYSPNKLTVVSGIDLLYTGLSVNKQEFRMRKYTKIDLQTAVVAEMTEEDFQHETADCVEVVDSEQFVSYKFEKCILIEDKIAEYDY